MGKPLRALIVEDSEDDTLLTVLELKRGGFEPEYERVETAETMTTMLETQLWDVVLSDHNLPDFSSPEALQVLQESGQDLPFIVVSGAIGETTAVALMRAGAHDYLMKGNLQRLAPVIERELREAEVRREHKRSEEGNRRLALALATTADAVVILGLDARITYANISTNMMFGYDRGELIGLEIWNLHPEAVRNTLARSIFQATMYKHWSGEFVGQTKDGHEFPIRLSTALMSTEQGKATGIVGIITDITEQKNAELALRRSKDETQKVANENANLAEIGRIIGSSLSIDEVYKPFVDQVARIISSDRLTINILNQEQNMITTAYQSGLNVPGHEVGSIFPVENNAVQRVFGESSAILVNMETREEFEGYAPALANHFEIGIRSACIAPLIARNRTIGTIHLSSTQPHAYSEQHLKIARRVASQIAGAISNAQLFVERVQAEENLRESENRYRAVVENSADGIAINVGDKRVYVNPAFLEIHGIHDASEVVGKPIDKYIVQEDRQEVIDRTLARQQNLPSPTFAEYRIRRPDGELRTLQISGAPINYAGEPASLTIVRDVTAAKQEEERLRETDRLVSVGKFAAGLAHEVNNPLAAILSFSELLLAQDLDQSVEDDIRTIQSEAHRAAKVVQDLLTFGRRQQPSKKVVNIAQIIQGALRLKAYDFRAQNIEEQVEFGDDEYQVMADENQLTQVFVNIFTNAQMAMANANGGGKISVNLEENGGYVRASVTDDGPGIPIDQLSKIFDPFYTTKPAGEGTGLGLSVSFGIIRDHDGRLWAESEPGEGATFHVELPTPTAIRHSSDNE